MMMIRFPVNTEFWPMSPFCPPHWRWARAVQLAERKDHRRHWDDPWIDRARRFLNARRRVGGDLVNSRRLRVDPMILEMVRLWEGQGRRRWEVEARLLTGQTDEEIADRMGLQPSQVAAYESLFYAVRDHLHRSDWIAFAAIGRRDDEFSPDDIASLWKSFAYHHGPQVLEALIGIFDGRVGGGSTAAADPGADRQLKLAVLLATTTVTPENCRGWLRLEALTRQIEQEAVSSDIAAVTRPITSGPILVPIGSKTEQRWSADGALQVQETSETDKENSSAMPGSGAGLSLPSALRSTG